jgi:hypothetical protein
MSIDHPTWCMLVHFGHVNLHVFISLGLPYRTLLFQLKTTIVAYYPLKVKSLVSGMDGVFPLVI